jgi:hypothetical protein
LAAVWVVISLGAVAVAAMAGWWLSSWLVGIVCLLGIGAVGGAIVGVYQGLRGRWVMFAEQRDDLASVNKK